MFIYLTYRCKREHQWDIILANYWCNPAPRCPECNSKATTFRHGGMVSQEEIQKRIKEQSHDRQESID